MVLDGVIDLSCRQAFSSRRWFLWELLVRSSGCAVSFLLADCSIGPSFNAVSTASSVADHTSGGMYFSTECRTRSDVSLMCPSWVSITRHHSLLSVIVCYCLTSLDICYRTWCWSLWPCYFPFVPHSSCLFGLAAHVLVSVDGLR